MSNKTSSGGHKTQSGYLDDDQTSDSLNAELRDAIRHMVTNISKSFIVEWYTSISPTNHDFVVSCETLIEDALTKLAELCVQRLDKYKTGQLVTSLLHDHVMNETTPEKIQSIEMQIENHEYDICQNSVVRLFGLLCTDELRQVIFTHDNTCGQDYRRDSPRSTTERPDPDENKSTSALYTLVIAMLTKAVFMPIVDSISKPNWLYAVIIWLCKREGREKAKSEVPGNSLEGQVNRLNEANINDIHHSTTSIIVTNTRSYRSFDLEDGIDIASANINFENPVCDSLKRPLDNIEIYATEEVKNNNSCYVLYCIRYDGLCHRFSSTSGFSFIPEQTDVPIIDKRATSSMNRRVMVNEPSTSKTAMNDTSERRSFRKKMAIKRRFREFVILQLRLEENPKIRPYMKNIPKPTKLKAATQSIFSLPGITNIKLDQSTIKLRQRFLERFLIALNSSPFIANSYEFKEFFSYNVNSANVNISKSKSLILQVNLNKVFVDSVRSALSMLRTSTPGEDYHLGSNPNPDAWLSELQQSTMKLHVQTRTSHSKMNLERYIDSKLSSKTNASLGYGNSSSLGRYFERNGFGQGSPMRVNLVKSRSTGSTSSSVLFSKLSSSSSRNIDSSSRSSSLESVYHDALSSLGDDESTQECNDIQICDSVPIASKIIDIVHYSLSRNSKCTTSFLNAIARIILGRTIERHAIKILESALTLKSATFCINGITNSIWDDGEDPPLDVENASLDEAVLQLTIMLGRKFTNYTFIPKKILQSIISKQVRFYLSQLSSQKRNKFVIYSFFVHLLDELESASER